MTDHPLRPATRHRLGRPLPHQQADRPQPAPSAAAEPPFTIQPMLANGPSGITHRFQWLSRSEGYVGYVLLTLSPLYSSEDFRARLACLIHAASVRSEPGSNPSVEVSILVFVGVAVLAEASHRPPLRHSKVTLVFKEHGAAEAAPVVLGGAWQRPSAVSSSAWRRVEEGDNRHLPRAVNDRPLFSHHFPIQAP